MSLTEQLLKADRKNVDELKEGTFESKALARALGKEGTVTIKIREVPARKLNECLDGVVDMNGNLNLAKSYEAAKKIIVLGCVDPDMKDKNLQEYFGCRMGVDLAEKLFKNEAQEVMNAIRDLSELSDVDEEDIKN